MSTSNRGSIHLGTRLRAIHDRMTFKRAKTIAHRVETLLVVVIAAVDDPAIRLHNFSSLRTNSISSARTCISTAGPRYLSAFHQYDGHAVLQHAHRMHSYRPSCNRMRFTQRAINATCQFIALLRCLIQLFGAEFDVIFAL